MSIAGEIKPILKEKGLDGGLSVLSLGCGIGQGEQGFEPEYLTGLDIFDYSEVFAGKFISGDVRQAAKLFSPGSFDVVICFDIIEHLMRHEGFKLIEDAEAISKRAVIFYTPIEFDDNIQEPGCWAYGNPYNKHQSLWQPADFIDYRIYKPFPADSSEGFLAVKWL